MNLPRVVVAFTVVVFATGFVVDFAVVAAPLVAEDLVMRVRVLDMMNVGDKSQKQES